MCVSYIKNSCENGHIGQCANAIFVKTTAVLLNTLFSSYLTISMTWYKVLLIIMRGSVCVRGEGGVGVVRLLRGNAIEKVQLCCYTYDFGANGNEITGTQLCSPTSNRCISLLLCHWPT